jgi:GNAT superfamily N-acetyltransferase
MNDRSKIINIRRMKTEDVPEVVRVHLQSFQGFFLTILGAKFLYWLYRSFVDYETGVALVAEYRRAIVGVVAGTTDQSRFYKLMLKKRWHRFAAAAAAAILRSPGIVSRLVRAVLYPRAASQAAAPGLLMSIAVDPNIKGLGVGGRLLNEYLSEMSNSGVYHISLTTDRDQNDGVNQFYQQKGFELSRCYMTPEGRAMNEYVIHLNEEAREG